jgi:type IV secretion system protein TrbG
MKNAISAGFLLAITALMGACASQSVSPPTVEAPAPRKEYTMADLRIPQTIVETAAPEKPEMRPTLDESRKMTAAANDASLDLPQLSCFKGKTCEYWYEPDRHFAVYVAYADQTLICMEPGEIINQPVIPGQQTYLRHEAYSFGGPGGRQCLAVMAVKAGLDLHGSILTDRRKYDINFKTFKKTKHIEVRWHYPDKYLAQINGHVPVLKPGVPGIDAPRDRHCAYEISGDQPPWMPSKTLDEQPAVCDDGEVTVINFKLGALGPYDSPALWRINEQGQRTMIQYGKVNSSYRVAGIHDHLLLAIGAAEVHIRRKAQ